MPTRVASMAGLKLPLFPLCLVAIGVSIVVNTLRPAMIASTPRPVANQFTGIASNAG